MILCNDTYHQHQKNIINKKDVSRKKSEKIPKSIIYLTPLCNLYMIIRFFPSTINKRSLHETQKSKNKIYEIFDQI